MERIQEKGILYKTSRVSYYYNYILIALIAIILLIIFPKLDFRNILHLIIFFSILMIAAGLGEEPEWERVFRKYIITNNEIIKFDGFIRKKKIILPYQSIADVRCNKGVIGRVLDFGDVEIVGFKDSIIMKGMKAPEEVQNIVQNKINISRGSVFVSRKREKE